MSLAPSLSASERSSRSILAEIEPEPNRPRYVITERGAGYRFPRSA